MTVSMLFVIASPRSGSTMLERMLESHSQIHGGPEPHLLTPLAHLGPYAQVDAAPYDPDAATAGQRSLLDRLPDGEADYWAACRAYGDALYGRSLAASGKPICLDKTPAYALVWPFLLKVFPDARYVVLTRHPLATFSSYANSFFDGDYFEAQRHNPILERYVPALAGLLRQSAVPCLRVRYEDLVQAPEAWMERISEYVGVPFEPETVDYGNRQVAPSHAKGLGDPIGVARHTRPSTASLNKWVEDLFGDPARQAMMRGIIEALDPADLDTLGYPKETVWRPLEAYQGSPPPKREPLTGYRIQRRLIVRLRNLARSRGLFYRAVSRMRAACNALLAD